MINQSRGVPYKGLDYIALVSYAACRDQPFGPRFAMRWRSDPGTLRTRDEALQSRFGVLQEQSLQIELRDVVRLEKSLQIRPGLHAPHAWSVSQPSQIERLAFEITPREHRDSLT